MWLFTKENAFSLIRTTVPFLYGWLLLRFPFVVDLMPPDVFVLVFGTLLYQGVRWLGDTFPWVEYVLIINNKPSYEEEDEVELVSP